jgi:hypothetical protein
LFALVPLHSCGAGFVPRRPAVLTFVLGGAVVRAHTPCWSACAIVRRQFRSSVPELPGRWTEFQPALPGVFAGAKSATSKCNEDVTVWVAETLAPFAAAEKPSFNKSMLKAIRKHAPPDWRPPTRKQVSGPLLDDLHRKVKHKVDAVFGLCALTFVSDGHSSDKTRCPIANYLACSTKGAHHLGIDDLSGGGGGAAAAASSSSSSSSSKRTCCFCFYKKTGRFFPVFWLSFCWSCP